MNACPFCQCTRDTHTCVYTHTYVMHTCSCMRTHTHTHTHTCSNAQGGHSSVLFIKMCLRHSLGGGKVGIIINGIKRKIRTQIQRQCQTVILTTLRPTSQGHVEKTDDWASHCVTWWPEIWRLAWLETRGGDHPSSDMIPKELMFINLLSETHAWFWVLLTSNLQMDFLSWSYPALLNLD